MNLRLTWLSGDFRDEYCDKIFKIASGKQVRLSLASE